MSEHYGFEPEDEDREGVEEAIAPGDPDFDLSEAHGYLWYPERDEWPVPRWALVAISIAVVAALVLPTIIFILRAN